MLYTADMTVNDSARIMNCYARRTKKEVRNPFGPRLKSRQQRTVDCISSGVKDDCILKASNAILTKDAKDYKCRRELMPQHEWNQLARKSTTTCLACPIGCRPEFDLSVISKVPFDNDKCQKYYTYGKYCDHSENEW
ncbi:hypothetical protein OESDEN_12063 [Oesophagostomum dentatum]|uniref:Uncharacterized protein n=1 Tax=Oesophagostomum dentatum TaxID=61180 RepID=A0A0B1SW99_OESDE|nr:hypothetical protein OESDEN_12063 [Oesophagostomum dentatum]